MTVDAAAGRLFPTFQFVNGRTRSVVGQVLEAMAGQVRGRELTLSLTF